MTDYYDLFEVGQRQKSILGLNLTLTNGFFFCLTEEDRFFKHFCREFLVIEEPFEEDLQPFESRINFDFFETDIDLNNCTNSFPSILAGTLSPALSSGDELASLTISFPRLSTSFSILDND